MATQVPDFPDAGPGASSRTTTSYREFVVTNFVLIGLAVFFFAISFLDWLGLSAHAGAFEASAASDAWGFPVCAIAVLIGVLVTVPAVLRLNGVHVPTIVIVGMCGIAFSLVLIKFIAGMDFDSSGFRVAVEKTREVGIYLALVTSGAMTAVAVLEFVTEGKRSLEPPATGC
ncbi:MAG TPA: hypothetical protein VIH82_04580 [Acidimicrobiia bacterium]|jgi:hypothetical protein